MLNLIIGLFLVCTTLGATISKTNSKSVVKKPRQHTEPLRLD
jgi:hypothetical protein